MASDVKLSKRLTAIAEMVGAAGPDDRGREKPYCLCDVGTDHAHIPIRLLMDGRIDHAIAMDVIEGPLEKARENIVLYVARKDGEILAGIAGSISDLSHGRAGRYFYRQESLLNAMYVERMKKSETSDYYTYPIAIERKLRTAVRSRDKAGSQTLLNQILAHIYVSNNNNIEAIKPRITELIVVISRAAVDAGADINEIFLINENFTANIEEFTNLEDLSAWVSNMLQRFISFTFEFDKVKHADAVYKVIEYIKTNFRRHMSLEDIAASTYLSKTYLSSLFKKETGYSISEYINIVRIDRSKSLLMEENMSIIEIANLCGFEDQSYFTKVFKHIVGITPKKYRENRGKNEKRDIILR